MGVSPVFRTPDFKSSERMDSLPSGSPEFWTKNRAKDFERIYAAYPHLNDDDFVRQGRDQWLMP